MTLPVVKTVTVAASQERAFTVFTTKMGAWWPADHHIGDAALADVVIEPREGGRWYERGADGSECDWGHVRVYRPFSLFTVAWQLQGDWRYDPDRTKASEVEVRFIVEAPDRTRVELEHRHLERHGDDGPEIQDAVGAPNGWPGILAGYAASV